MSKHSSNLKSRNFKGGSYSTVLTVIVIAIILVVNIIVNVLPADVTKLDYSEEKLYTLSDQTNKILDSLDEDITVYVIAQSGKEDESLTELLNKYKAASGKHIKIVNKDPAVNPNFTAQYTEDSLSDNSVIVESSKRAKVVSVDDIYVTSYTKSSTSSTGYTQTSTFNGEDALTSALDYVTTDNLPRMYVVTGHGESSMESSFQSSIQRENIELVELSLATVKEIPSDADCLYIQAPTSDINQDEAQVLKDYIAKGGNIFYTSFYQKGNTPNLDSVLAEFGIAVDSGIVCEGNSNYVMQNMRNYIRPMYGEHDIVKPLSAASEVMVVPFGQNIRVLENRKSTLKSTTLLKTTSTGYIKSLDADTLEKSDGDQTGAMTLAIAVTDTINDNTQARLVAVTSPYISNSQMDTYVSGGNYDFLLNSVSFLCEHESMISIRGKNVYSTSLAVTSGQMTAWIFVLMILIPLGVIVTGLVIWLRRRKR